MKLEQLLQEMVDAKASDVFIIAGLPLAYSVSGRQVRLDSAPFKPADTEAFVSAIYEAAGRSMAHFVDNGNHDEDFSFAVPGVGRFRANIFRQRGSFGAVIRVIPFGLPNPVEYHIPDEVLRLSTFQKGLVLVTGPAGAGKSTTLACIIDRLNHERTGHIITMEDPIEYIYTPDQSIISQREIGQDTETYHNALRAVLREDPDIILIGEMRDLDTIQTALTAAETGHFVLATLHTKSAADSIDRMVDVFPEGLQRQIRMQLSTSLVAVLSQQLLPRRDGMGRSLACELMMVTPAIRNLIREGKTPQIASALGTSAAAGSVTMDNALIALARNREITSETAVGAAHDVDFVRKNLR